MPQIDITEKALALLKEDKALNRYATYSDSIEVTYESKKEQRE